MEAETARDRWPAAVALDALRWVPGADATGMEGVFSDRQAAVGDGRTPAINGQAMGVIEGADFTAAIVSPWLGEDPYDSHFKNTPAGPERGTPMKTTPLKIRVAYSLPAFALAIIGIPVYVYIPKFYTDVVGIDIAVAGALLFGVRLFDAVTDPLMGTLSDRTRSRFGRRRPYIAVGSVLIAVALFFLFNPRRHRSAGARSGLPSGSIHCSVLDPGHGSLRIAGSGNHL